MRARINEIKAQRDEVGSGEGVPGNIVGFNITSSIYDDGSGSGEGATDITSQSTTTTTTSSTNNVNTGSEQGVTGTTSQSTTTTTTSTPNNEEAGSGDNVWLINDENERSGRLHLVWEIASSEEEELSGV